MASTASRWVKPEVYPLLAAVGTAAGLSIFALTRKIIADPGISVSKEVRAHGMADDLKQGQKYKMNFVRRAVADRSPEIMPAFNRWCIGTPK
ncbi:unnamed protein product [Closterium sp. NIES-54]